MGKGKGAHMPKAQMARVNLGFLSMKHAIEYCYSPLDGMLVYRRVTPSSTSPVPIKKSEVKFIV